MQVHVSNSEPCRLRGPPRVRGKTGLKAEFPSAELSAEAAAQCVGYRKVSLLERYTLGVSE